MKEIKVGFAGVGSNTSATMQMIALAQNTVGYLAGIKYNQIGPYEVSNLKVSCAFDVDTNKVGKDISDAIFSYPNACEKFVDVSHTGVEVVAGPLLDGLDGDLSERIIPVEEAKEVSIDDVTLILRETKTDVLVCNLPTGATKAVQAYAMAALQAGVAFVNGTPESVSRNKEIEELFRKSGVPLLGDDLRSHLGATTLHMALIELMQSRGIKITDTYQLNVGGNMDFLNLASPGRCKSKQISKKNALYAAGIDASRVTAGPNGFVEYLKDTKVCYLHIEGNNILNSKISLEMKLEVQDSPNAAGVIVNAIRCAKLARDKQLAGSIDEVCPYLFKSPRIGKTESEGLRAFAEFVSEK